MSGIKQKPLVIVATPNICWLNPGVEYPKKAPEIIAEAVKYREAGASVLHTHAEGQWSEVINGVRAKSDIIIQSGMSSIPLQERIGLFERKSDMVSIIANHHAEAFTEVNCDVQHPLAELEEYCIACRKYGVKPEWEIWHAGFIWNLNQLIKKGLLDPPYITTFFLGWPGGTWSPLTVQEYLYRKSLMPENRVITVSIMCAEQMDILVTAITQGDNVRVGTEDWPYLQNGKVATTHELVKEIADISRSLGREVATPAQAREMTGLK
ncbi:MAG: 3-keto-5-aminohexanoate cleavage protein [Spirochaetaceae bacterium]|jgi:3-keto-5-aminohexanoate cleavage enzyme|nr:3-keto-5-aminohexanoate cleavage protein [Spirochaetaceae bacterium]